MDYLRRRFAPLSDAAWKALDETVVQTARHQLAARHVATLDGPKGWEHIGARVGSMRPCRAPESTASVCVPDVVLLAELRTEFSLPWSAIEAFERGAPALDARAAEAAAREIALAEDALLLYGDPVGTGFLTSKDSPRVQIRDWSRPGQVLSDLLAAIQLMDAAGVPGPYEALLPASRYYAYVKAASEGGYPVTRHLRPVLGAVHRSGVLREAGAVFSTRGGDFVMTVGGDLSVGYRQHDRDAVHLMCVETVAGQCLTPEAVCLLGE
jgi:uncharacterized linocin/CFP29 family protein